MTTGTRATPMPRLSTFILENTEQILAEWETFARSLPMGESMDIAAIRDHAKDMLLAIARDLERPQSSSAQAGKARGESDAGESQEPTAAQEHGAGRAESGFTVGQMVSEFRALRASVMRLWSRQQHQIAAGDLADMTRFNEAIDQAIAESIARFSREVGQTQERFLAILGHDLRTPLGAIITSTRFMLDADELVEPYRTLVARTASSARRMNQMVVDLIEFTRTRLGDGIPIVRSDTDAGKLVHDVLSEIAAAYPGTNIQVATSGDLRGQWDAERLTQALTNLAGNAVQHGRRGAPIRVSASGTDGQIEISVHNEGPPIPHAEVPAIFQAMTQGSGTGTRDRRHQGLGLYIVEKIVTAHGGTVSVDSTAEHGTTFTIRLPRAAQ